MSAVVHFDRADALSLGVVVLLLAASAFLAMAETSLIRTSRAKAISLVDDKRRGARALLGLVEHPETFLNAVLLLVLVCQLVVATLVGLLAAHWFGAWGVAVSLVFEVIVIFVLAEAIPKNWAVHNSERSALVAAPVVAAIVRFPPVRVLCAALVGLARLIVGRGQKAGVSESELLALADVAMEEQVIETEERALIHSIIEFGDTVVREVMVPRPDMRTVEADQSISEALEDALVAGYSRLPAHDRNVDDVVGVAYVKDLVRAERNGHGAEPVRGVLRPAHYVPESKRVAGLMREMQERQVHLAIVVDEYGGTAGLVTLEDLIEELVGEIVDEFDVEEPPYEVVGPAEVVVSARFDVGELRERLGVELPEGDYDTVGGLVFASLGKVPSEGESVDIGPVRLAAERVEGNRIGRVRVVKLPEGDGASPTGDGRSDPGLDGALGNADRARST